MVLALVERGETIAPVLAAVEAVVETALVVANPAVVLTGNDVARVRRIDLDQFLRLAAERAVLVHPHVAVGVARTAAQRALGDLQLVDIRARSGIRFLFTGTLVGDKARRDHRAT